MAQQQVLEPRQPAPSWLEKPVEYVPFMGHEPIKLSAAIVKNFLCKPTKSGALCDDRQAMRFVMLCQARQMNPFEGDAYIVGYDTKDGPEFNLITGIQTHLKRAETHPEYDGLESGVIVRTKSGEILDREGDFFLEDDFLLGGWATVYFKNRSHPMKKRLRLASFNKGYGRWKEDAAGMIVKCAEADALRSSFPTLLGGMYLEDEMPAIQEPKQVQELPVGRVHVSPNGGGKRIESKPPASTQAPLEPPQTEEPPPEPQTYERQPGDEPDEDPAIIREDLTGKIRELIGQGEGSQAAELLSRNDRLLGQALHDELLGEWRTAFAKQSAPAEPPLGGVSGTKRASRRV